MKKILFLLAFTLLYITVSAQKLIHDPNAEVRDVKGFHAIEVSGGIDLYLSSGDETVAVSAKGDEVRRRVKTEVKNGVLKIYFEWKDGIRFSLGNNRALKAYVSYKNLDKISASGGSDVMVDGTIK